MSVQGRIVCQGETMLVHVMFNHIVRGDYVSPFFGSARHILIFVL